MSSLIDENLARAEALVESVGRGENSRDPRDIKSRTIGQVLSQLDLDFPGISASKIRFLEERGLVYPKRTDTGYRKYSQTDIERLRYILTMQRDYYMPLTTLKPDALLTQSLRRSLTRCWTKYSDPPTTQAASTPCASWQSTQGPQQNLLMTWLNTA